MGREEDVQRLAQMILQTPPVTVTLGGRSGKRMFSASWVAEHLLRQGVILPPVKKRQEVMTAEDAAAVMTAEDAAAVMTAEDAAAVMTAYREAKNTPYQTGGITIERLQDAIHILQMQEAARRQLIGPLRYDAAAVPFPEEYVIEYFCGTGVDVVDRAGRIWRNGKIIPR